MSIELDIENEKLTLLEVKVRDQERHIKILYECIGGMEDELESQYTYNTKLMIEKNESEMKYMRERNRATKELVNYMKRLMDISEGKPDATGT